jgi:integrase
MESIAEIKEFLRKHRKYKTHYFSREDVPKLINNETYLDRKTAFRIAYDVGSRAGEIIKVSAEHFDFDKGEMVHWDSKKKAWKIVPLSQETLNMVKMFLHSSKITTRLFPVTTHTLNNWIKEAARRENITPDKGIKLRWHSWRGTFIRHNQDKPLKWVMQITGDSTITILGYYSELTDADMHKIKNEGLENNILEVINGQRLSNLPA